MMLGLDEAWATGARWYLYLSSYKDQRLWFGLVNRYLVFVLTNRCKGKD